MRYDILTIFMRDTVRSCLLALAAARILSAGDPYCPKYPQAVRTEMEESLALDREFQIYSRSARSRSAASSASSHLAASGNFIDQLMSKKMSADGVDPAPRTTDPEFLRRIYLDLTGRIPTPEQADRFLKDATPNKREALIDELLVSPAYADQFALFFANRFRVTRTHESISTPARGVFYNFLRQAIANDRPYDDFVRELLSARGEVDKVP